MTMGSNKDFRCQPALAHLLQVATRQAMHTSQVQGPHRIQTVFSGDSHWYGPTTKYLPIDPEEDSFISSEGDISLLQEGYHEKEHSVLFKDLVLRSGYAQCSEKQILLGKIFEQV